MNIVLDDLTIAGSLYPFSATRSIADIRVGILTLREKWEMLLGAKVLVASEMKAMHDRHHEAGSVQENFEIPSDAIVFSANTLPNTALINQLSAVNSGISPSRITVRKIEFAWQIIAHNLQEIKNDHELLTKGRISRAIDDSNKISTPGDIFIEQGASVTHSVLNASDGPIYIGKNAIVMEGCLIRGPFAIGEGTVVKMGTKIYGGTSCGPFCTLGGEIKNSLLFGYSNKAHDGYLGDSVIGEWCNLGAGTTTSNLKNTAAEIKMWDGNQMIDTGKKKGGLLMGDHSRAAINTSFNTGTVVGTCCNIFGHAFPPKFVADFTWGQQKYSLEKALVHIENWKQLKGEKLTVTEKRILTDLYIKSE